MRKLGTTVQFHPDETLVSFASRLGIANGVRRVQDFCMYLGLSHRKIIDGDRAEAGRLLALAGIDDSALEAKALVREGFYHRINGEYLSRGTFMRHRLRYCKQCLLDDLERQPDPFRARPYGRLSWCVTFIRTCPRHRQLLQLARLGEHSGTHDIARMIEWELTDGELDSAIIRDPTPFEAYVGDRIWGRGPNEGWLDELPLYVAGRLCEWVGATSMFGRRFIVEEISDGEWVGASQHGFDILRLGQQAFEDFLRSLHDIFWEKHSDVGGRVLYGRLYERLAHETDDPAFEAIRKIMYEVSLNALPFGPGDDMFGPIDERRVHSIMSASKSHGVHPKTLRKIVKNAGLISRDHAGLTDERVLLPAQKIDALLETVHEALSWTEAREFLGAGRTLWNTLSHEGYIPSILNGGRETGLNPFYRRQDLQEFLKKVMARVTCSTGHEGMVSIASVTRRANCKFSEVLDLLLDGKIARVAVDHHVYGLEALLFDVDEVRQLTRLPDHGGLSLTEAERQLAINDKVLWKLIELGHLKVETAINPVNRCPQRIIRPATMAGFQAEFISLFNLARQRGEHFRTVKRDLEERGIVPAIVRDAVGATFYRRCELDDC